jgi:type VI secretion system protein ImpI/type VI secretion system protein
VVPEHRRIEGDAVALGRGSENDWILPDPERVLSKRHCTMARRNNIWHVVDSSSNGTFLNGRCLDPGVPRPLRNGDRLAFGAYEIEVLIAETRILGPAQDDQANPFGDFGRLTGDPFPLAETGHMGEIGLPHDFNRLGEDGLFGDTPLPASDHVPAIQSAFVPPRVASQLLPDDWDEEWTPAETAGTRSAPSERESGQPMMPVGAPPAVLERSVPATPATAAMADGLADALALVTGAAGIDGQPRGTPSDTLQALGRAFRALVVGLRRTMIGRATIKGEFRIEQTMIQASGNNPLKFSADDDDALSALLGIGRRIDMNAETAVAEALHDIRLHDLAVSAAMQQAVREMLDRLDPGRLRADLPREALDGLNGRRDRRAWQAFVTLHGTMLRAFADDFDSVFGRAFARAYEQVQTEIAAQDGQDQGKST